MERPRVFMWKKMIFLNKIIKRKKLKSPNLEKNDLRYLKILIQMVIVIHILCTKEIVSSLHLKKVMLYTNKIIIKSYYMLIKQVNSLIIKLNYSLYDKFSRRFMLSRANINLTNKILAPHDAEQLAKASLSFFKTFTTCEIVEELQESVKTLKATEFLVKKTKAYINEDHGSTSIMKTNFLAIFEYKNKQLTYPYVYLANLNKDPKIIYHPDLLTSSIMNTTAVRTLVEYPIIENIVKNPQINKVTILGDTIPIPGRTKNLNRDILIMYSTGKETDMDIKTKVFDNDITSGHIRQIDVINNQIITYPRDYSEIQKESMKIYSFLKQQLLCKNINFTVKDKIKFKENVALIEETLNKKENYLANHSTINNALWNINSLHSYPLTLSINNIHHIKNGPLTSDEMRYINEAIQYADITILSKPSYMRAYLIKCLEAYHRNVDQQVIKNIRPLHKVFPFIKNFLTEHCDITNYI